MFKTVNRLSFSNAAISLPQLKISVSQPAESPRLAMLKAEAFDESYRGMGHVRFYAFPRQLICSQTL
jgi:hypothetical protein